LATIKGPGIIYDRVLCYLKKRERGTTKIAAEAALTQLIEFLVVP